MGWNEPPDGNKGKDPWGNRGNGEGPPDLDEIVRKMQEGIGGIFGKKSPNIGGGSDGSTQFTFAFLFVLLLIWLAYDVFYAIDQQERGVVLRFGAYQTTLQPGPNFRWPRPFETVTKINVEQVRPLTHKAAMLTQDENIVDVEVAVQWKIKDPVQYLFEVSAPAATLRQVTESAVREVIGKSKLDYVLTEGRGPIAQSQLTLIQQTLDDYKTGIMVSAVEMQPAKPPEEVKGAFDDAIKAREDEQRTVNEAEAYRNEIIPRARGAAARLREEANAYKSKVVARAEGEASRFEQLLKEYERAPEITRERLYLETMESVFANTSKVLIDGESNNSLMYLPIDKLIKDSGRSSSFATPREFKPEAESKATQEMRERFSERTRGTR